MVFGVMASSSSARSGIPSLSTPSHVTSNPWLSRARQLLTTAGCSARVVMMWFPRSCRAAATPLTAMLSASVPQEVKTTSTGSQLRRSATFSRAFSTAPLTLLPAQWMLEGLPYRSR